jgi:hypothetical protein
MAVGAVIGGVSAVAGYGVSGVVGELAGSELASVIAGNAAFHATSWCLNEAYSEGSSGDGGISGNATGAMADGGGEAPVL